MLAKFSLAVGCTESVAILKSKLGLAWPPCASQQAVRANAALLSVTNRPKFSKHHEGRFDEKYTCAPGDSA